MKHLLLLHGALGAKDQFDELPVNPGNKHIVHRINFPGHGGTAFSEVGFSIPAFAHEVIRYLDNHTIDSTSIFGYSMGGYVALYIAKQHPQRVERIITLATKFHWDESTAAKEVKMLDPVLMQQKIPAFTQQLAQRHAPNDWKEVVEKTKDMMIKLGQDNTLQLEDYKRIDNPVLVLLGDRDKMVTIDETIAVYKQLPAGQLGILPATPHPFEQVNTELLGNHINRFLYQPIP